jgi:hypothetical protein
LASQRAAFESITNRPDLSTTEVDLYREGTVAATQIVTYRVDDETTVDIEVDPAGGYAPAGVGDVAGRVREAAAPAVKAARVVLEQARALSPDSVQVRFGIKVGGKVDWLVARAATEGNFEVTLSWRPAAADRPRP